MLSQLQRLYPTPYWADERYQRLAFLDGVLSGEMFKSLKGSFYDESLLSSTGRKARLTERNPAVRYNIARMVARQTARKLFSGRHAPRFTHGSNPKLALAAEALTREGYLKTRILQAVNWGSIGSVCVTFAILPGGENIPRIVFNVYRARMCTPILDSLGELKSLRLWYTISADSAKQISKTDFLGNRITKDKQYWFVRDYLPGREVTYVPVEVGSKEGTHENSRLVDYIIQTMELRPLPDFDFHFDSEIVPAHWFVNLSGGEFPDGSPTWEDAIPGMIEIAFTLSQVGRGVRYNATPQLVTIGRRKSEGGPYSPGQPRYSRDAAEVLALDGASEDAQGKKTGAGDAKLLEMKGNSVAAALKYCESIRKIALEQIGASRKDPDRLHFPQSGKAMEMLDEDFFDLVGELRTAYGDYGLIPLMKKALTVASKAHHPLLKDVSLTDLDELALRWPRFYAPTAQEFNQFAQGLAVLVTGGKAAGQEGGTQTGIVLTREEARQRLDEFLDIPPETTSVALQQRPREEIVPTLQPEHTESSLADPGPVAPHAKDLPPQSTSLGNKPYTQQ